MSTGRRDVCLIDVYETLLTVDFASLLNELATMARVPSEVFGARVPAAQPGTTVVRSLLEVEPLFSPRANAVQS
jgi:hypothetical protein